MGKAYAVTIGGVDADWEHFPLCYNLQGEAPTKAKMVETMEWLVSSCGLPLTTREGLRLYGGHSARVTGAQALAAAGISVEKIRILARHSGDTVLRYVAEAPLRTLRADLGLPEPGNPTSGLSGTATAKSVRDKLAKAMARLEEHESQLTAIRALVTTPNVRVYVENLLKGSVHGMREGDACYTVCGWYVGPERAKRGGVRWLRSVADVPWWQLCERCLLAERQSAKLLAGESEQPLSD